MSFLKSFKWHLYNYEDYLWSKFQLNLTLLTGVIAPNPSKMGLIGSRTKKTLLFLLSKVENNKYPEAETWHPGSIDGWSYYRLCENFWWPFNAAPVDNLEPIWDQKMFFCLILQEFSDFWGTWDLHYLIFLRMYFLQKFWF